MLTELDPFAWLPQFMKLMIKPGAFLTTINLANRPNVMAIGWANVGFIWGKPIFMAMVRPTRHSYACLEEVRQFGVCLPPPALAAAIARAGSRSGREVDKFADAKLEKLPARRIKPPMVQGCLLHYECAVVYYNDLVPENLQQGLRESCYPKDDFHRLYFGEILTCYGDTEDLIKF